MKEIKELRRIKLYASIATLIAVLLIFIYPEDITGSVFIFIFITPFLFCRIKRKVKCR